MVQLAAVMRIVLSSGNYSKALVVVDIEVLPEGGWRIISYPDCENKFSSRASLRARLEIWAQEKVKEKVAVPNTTTLSISGVEYSLSILHTTTSAARGISLWIWNRSPGLRLFIVTVQAVSLDCNCYLNRLRLPFIYRLSGR